MAPNDNTITMEDVELIFRNFEGRESQYNMAGVKNFGVILPDEGVAADLAQDGWNVKFLQVQEDEEDDREVGRPWLPVKINWKGRPPRVVMITSRGRTNLSEKNVELLDWVDIKTVDLIINPYHYNVNGKSGTSAYCKAIFVTVDESPLDLKYAHLPEQGVEALPEPDETPAED